MAAAAAAAAATSLLSRPRYRSLSYNESVPRDDDQKSVDSSESIWTDVPAGFGVLNEDSHFTGEGIRPKNAPSAPGLAKIMEKEREEEKRARIHARILMGAGPDGTFTNCPPMTGKIRNQYMSRKSPEEALADCGDDEALKKAVLAATQCEEYKAGKAVPADFLTTLCEVVGARSQSRCRFPSCGKLNVRTDRAKEHARVHIGNHPFKCTKIQADEGVGCGATFLRKHDRNRHNNGSDVLTCEDCGSSIQGKGREYNLQRHKSNYCRERKTTKPTQTDQHQPHLRHAAQSSPDSGSSAGKTPNNSAMQVELPMPAMMQVHGPVPASTALPMPMVVSVSVPMSVDTSPPLSSMEGAPAAGAGTGTAGEEV